jgi:hypothetical protein
VRRGHRDRGEGGLLPKEHANHDDNISDAWEGNSWSLREVRRSESRRLPTAGQSSSTTSDQGAIGATPRALGSCGH